MSDKKPNGATHPPLTAPQIALLNSVDDPNDPKGYPNSSITKTIYCHNSGVVLGRLEICIFEGHLAYFEAHQESVYLHPFYGLPHPILLRKLEEALHYSQEKGWVLSWREQQRLQLLMSAGMHNLDCIKQESASLPSFDIAAGSAGRLLHLARWFFFISSQRLAFPVYSISKRNENLKWENYKYWLDSALHIRDNWSKKARVLELDAKKKAQDESMREIKSESVFKRLDIRKIWNWMELQLELHYAPGRIKTFQTLFLHGDLEVHEWTVDDVDDLVEAVLEHCDQGNEIMFFIRKRLNGIAALIKDFYSSFTIVTPGDGKFTEDQQTAQEDAFLNEYDKRASALAELPPKPKRESFETFGKFLKAEAEWSILAKRFKLMQKRAGNSGPTTGDL